MKIINSILELTALNLHDSSEFLLCTVVLLSSGFNIEQFQGFTKWQCFDQLFFLPLQNSFLVVTVEIGITGLFCQGQLSLFE